MGASPDSRDVEYCRVILGGSFGALFGLRVRVLFCSPVGNFVSDTGENLKVLFDAFKKYYKFCPNCGALMADEAVEMVMKKLEGMG